MSQSEDEITSEGKLLRYYHTFYLIAMYLKNQKRISEPEVNRYFWHGLHRDTRHTINRRLKITIPQFDHSAPQPIDNVMEAGRFMFSDDVFDAEHNDPITNRLRSLKEGNLKETTRKDAVK